MANFTPSKKTAQDFNNGVEYVDGIDEQTGDVVQAETINNLVESALYTQEQAKNATNTANSALNKINDVLETTFDPNGNYPNVTVGNVTNAPPPAVGLHHIQFAGEPTPAAIWAGTTWEIDTDYQGRTLIGSGGAYAFGATGGSADAIVVNHEHAQTLTWATGAVISEVYNLNGSGASVYGGYVTGTGHEGTGSPTKTRSTGESATGKNMPPYAVANYWVRTA